MLTTPVGSVPVGPPADDELTTTGDETGTPTATDDKPKLAAGGASLAYSTYLGGDGAESAAAMLVDAAGGVQYQGISGERRTEMGTDLPLIVGFGIKTPEAAQGIAAVADGCVVGSAIVKRIGEGQSPAQVLVAAGKKLTVLD